MDGPEAYGVSQEAARVVAGSAIATGGYGYFTKARGWRLVVGIVTSFGGGALFYRAAMPAVMMAFGEVMPELAAGVACSSTLGIIYAIRKWAGLLELMGEKK